MIVYMLSDFHFTSQNLNDEQKQNIKSLCEKIRSETPLDETILFILMGDIVHRSNTRCFSAASECLSLIKTELSSRNDRVQFHIIPGNHDLPQGDITAFVRFAEEFCKEYLSSTQSVYSIVCDGVNLIFSDSTINRDHTKPGSIDKNTIKKYIKQNMTNALFCHHAFTHNNGDIHDTIEYGEEVMKELKKCGISYFFHAHTHKSNSTIHENDEVEIGCGTYSMDVTDMKGVFNQFAVAYFSHGSLQHVDRLIITSDGNGLFPKSTLYPIERTFSDPWTVSKVKYSQSDNYISRKVLPHDLVGSNEWELYLSRDKRLSLYEAVKFEKRILFISEAGQGKSYELKNLAYQFSASEYFPVFVELRNSRIKPIIEFLPNHYRNLHHEYLIFLFDGYDEISSEEQNKFIKELKEYIKDNQKAKIVISSRSNFCKIEKGNDSSTITGFKVYDLCGLLDSDINEYLDNMHIVRDAFFRETQRTRIYPLLKNAFYLTQVCDLYRKKGQLPDKVDLMDTLINNRFSFDDQKYVDNLEERYHELYVLLKKTAFAMQLRRQSSLEDFNEYQQLFDNSERDLLKHSGLLIKIKDRWQFEHNNFREYLAARYLSEYEKEDVIKYIMGEGGIRPSWVNVVGFLSGMNVPWLMEWAAKNAPHAVVKFESDRVPDKTRYDIFLSIFMYHEERHIWYNDALCSVSELALFSESKKTLLFLIDRIKCPVHQISRYLAIDILRYFKNGLFGYADEVRESLLGCCFSEPRAEKDVCRLAIHALLDLKLYNNNTTEQLYSAFYQSNEDYIRLAMYEYFLVLHKQNEYVEFFLEGLPYVMHGLNNRNHRIGNESFELAEGLKAMSEYSSVKKVMEWYKENYECDYHRKEIMTAMIKNAVVFFMNGNTEIFDVVIECVNTFSRYYVREISKICFEFFVLTDTLRRFVMHELEHYRDDIRRFRHIVYISHEITNTLIELYEDGIYDDHENFKNIVEQTVTDKAIYKKCSSLLKKKGNLKLRKYVEPIDFSTIHVDVQQEFFNDLFDKKKLETLLEELLRHFSDENVTIGKLERFYRIKYQNTKLREFVHSIRHIMCDNNALVKDLFTIVDYDVFLIVTSNRYASNDKIECNEEQKKHLTNILVRYANEGLFVPEKENSRFPKSVAYSAIELAFNLDAALPEKTMLELTKIGYFYFKNTKSNDKYAYILRHCDYRLLEDQVQKNLKDDSLDRIIWEEHFEFCTEQKSYVATAKALEICKAPSCNTHVSHAALKYLYTMYGGEYVEENVMPYADYTMLKEIYYLCKEDVNRKLLKSLFEDMFSEESTLEHLSILIQLQSEIGIQAYLTFLKKKRTIPEIEARITAGPTHNLRNIYDISLLPYLCEMLKIACDKNFRDDNEYDTLRGAVAEALINCGKSNDKLTIDEIEKCRESMEQTERNLRLCNHTIERIKENAQFDMDNPLSIKQICKILKGL